MLVVCRVASCGMRSALSVLRQTVVRALVYAFLLRQEDEPYAAQSAFFELGFYQQELPTIQRNEIIMYVQAQSIFFEMDFYEYTSKNYELRITDSQSV